MIRCSGYTTHKERILRLFLRRNFPPLECLSGLLPPQHSLLALSNVHVENIHTHTDAPTPTHPHRRTHTNVPTPTHPHRRTSTDTPTPTHPHRHTHTDALTPIHSHTHHAHTYTHTHTGEFLSISKQYTTPRKRSPLGMAHHQLHALIIKAVSPGTDSPFQRDTFHCRATLRDMLIVLYQNHRPLSTQPWSPPVGQPWAPCPAYLEPRSNPSSPSRNGPGTLSAAPGTGCWDGYNSRIWSQQKTFPVEGERRAERRERRVESGGEGCARKETENVVAVSWRTNYKQSVRNSKNSIAPLRVSFVISHYHLSRSEELTNKHNIVPAWSIMRDGHARACL